MKKKTLRFMACAAVMALTLSVTACGGGEDGSVNSEVVQAEQDEEIDAEIKAEEVQAEIREENQAVEDGIEEAEAENEEAEEVDEETEDYDSLEEMFADPEIKDAFDQMFSVLDGSGISLNLEVTGNEFIMTLKVEDSSLLSEGIEEGLAATLDEQEEQYKEYAAQFDELLEKPGATTVTVRYVDPDDAVLAERSYKAD